MSLGAQRWGLLTQHVCEEGKIQSEAQTRLSQEAVARRMALVPHPLGALFMLGSESFTLQVLRPLLHHEHAFPFLKTLGRFTNLPVHCYLQV